MRKIIPKNARLVPPAAKKVFEGHIYDVYQWQQEMFDGSRATYEMLKRPDTVKILAIKDNKIVIVEEEQPGYRAFYDLPGGRHDIESEDELEAAKREMLEETGMTFRDWKLIDAHQPLSKIEQFVYLFLATDFESQVDQKLDSGEKIQLHLKSFEETLSLCDNPKSRYLPRKILESAGSIKGLLNLPDYTG